MKLRAVVAGVVAVALFTALSASASTPVGPVLAQTQNPSGNFNAPFTGVSYTTSGEAGNGGGLVWSFSGLTGLVPSQYADIEWGFANATAVQAAYDAGPVTL